MTRARFFRQVAVAAGLAFTLSACDGAAVFNSKADPTSPGSEQTPGQNPDVPFVAPGGEPDPVVAKVCPPDYAPGHVSIHRLTNEEYNNTVRDLLFVSSRPADAFPPSAPGYSGFTNDSDNLTIFDDLVTHYYDSAETLAKAVIASKGAANGAYGKLVKCAPAGSGAPPATTTIRVAAGQGSVPDSSGQLWGADAFFVGGIANKKAVPVAIANTTEDALYNSERYGQDAAGAAAPFSYVFPNLTNGNYTVVLKFAEVFISAAGGRKFNVSINGKQLLTEFDIFAAAGGANTAVDKQFVVAVTGGKMEIVFSPGSIQKPKVNAIALALDGTTPPPTPPLASCAEDTVRALATRAYRRPITEGTAESELTALMKVFNATPDFDAGLRDVITTVLISPKFIFSAVTGPQARTAGATFLINDFALASRLSYFLWQSMPDEELFGLAKSGALADPTTLRSQVARMLKDPKAATLNKVLRNEMFGLSTLASATGNLQGLDEGVRKAMIGEVDAFLNDLTANDRSFLNVVTGKYAFVNKALATHYGLPFTGSDPAAFLRVEGSGMRRIGLVTGAALMTATAGDIAYTHPVQRGHWVTQRILCSEAPPPPDDIPVVDFDPAGGSTPREKLAVHSSNLTCKGCHMFMDPVGLGLENFDTFGRWRTHYTGITAPIDATGTIPNGAAFTDAVEMYDQLGSHPKTQSCLVRQVMSFALTRAMSSLDADQCVTSAIGASAITPDGTMSGLVSSIVLTHQFRMQTGEAP